MFTRSWIENFIVSEDMFYLFYLKACETLDELGIVLSHEIAHVVLGHVEEKLTLTSFVQV